MPMQATTTTPLFAAELTPQRSLGARGGWTVFSLCALLAALPGLGLSDTLSWIGVAVLMALVAVGIGLTLLIALRQGKKREQITVWADQIEWAAIDLKGERTLRRFNPKTVRLVLERDADEKTISMQLRAGKDALEVGAFLNSDDKSSFAKALGTALRKARAAA